MMEEKKLDPRDTDVDNRNGYAPFPPTMVVSSERSGLNLLRHMVESLTPHRTPGKLHIHDKGLLLFHRTHRVNPKSISPGRAPIFKSNGASQYQKMILLLRDPREIYVRAYKKNINEFKTYCQNILAFARFDGEKEVIYYDDLIAKDSTFERIFNLLKIESYFKRSSIPFLREDSVKWYDTYQQKGGGSQTKGDIKLLKKHQASLSRDELIFLETFLKNELKAEMKYLDRWRKNNQWL